MVKGIRTARVRTTIARAPPGGAQLEKSLESLCGTDYMEQLSTVTGAITTIDLDLYRKAIEVFDSSSKKILVLLDRIRQIAPSTELHAIFIHLDEQYRNMAFMEKAIVPNRKTGNPQVEDAYIPKSLISSEWFSIIRSIESNIFHTIDDVFNSGEVVSKLNDKRKNLFDKYSYEDFSRIIDENPLLNIKVFDIVLADKTTYEYFLRIHDYASNIVNLIMQPMYDVQARLEKSWDKTLSKVFAKMKDMNKDLIVRLMTQFVYAKYRTELTGNPKFFTEMLQGGDDKVLASLDGARFLDVMDTINLEQMDPSSKGRKFTEAAKTIMHKLVASGDTIDPKLIGEVESILKDDMVGEALTELSTVDTEKVYKLSLLFATQPEEKSTE